MFVRIIVVVVIAAILLGGVAIMYEVMSEEAEGGALFNFSEDLVIKWEVVKWINDAVQWIVVNWEPFFDAIGTVVLGILVWLKNFLLWLPWWLIVLVTTAAAWRVVNVKLGIVVFVLMLLMAFLGMLDLAMETLAIMFTATLLCVIVGVPTGIIAAKSSRFDDILRPILDGMQTMPSFVYLVPALMLFGLGMMPATMATCIYAIPPIVRLTNLGIRQVDAQVVEAARSFGSTAMQLLVKVQVPLALPTILAGLTQTVMMALAMAVLATMIGAGGLGVEVLTGIGRINAGQGFIGGISIVFVAIILDRISQGFIKRPETSTAT